MNTPKHGRRTLVLLLVSAAAAHGQSTEFLYTYSFVTTDSLGSPGNPGATASFSYLSTARLNNGGNFKLTQGELLEGTVEFYSDGSSANLDITNPDEVRFPEKSLTGIPLGQLSLLAGNPAPSIDNIFSANIAPISRKLGATGGSFGSNPFTGGPFAGEWSLTSLPIPVGGHDLDSDVDGADFLYWQRGESPVALSAADLAKWQDNFGSDLGAIPAFTTAVPEPSSLVSLLLAGLLVLLRHRTVTPTTYVAG